MNQKLDNFEIWICTSLLDFVNWCNEIAYDYFAIINIVVLIVGIFTFAKIMKIIFKSKKTNLFKIDKFIVLKNNLAVDTLKIAIIIIATMTIASFIDFYKFKVIGMFFNQYLLITILFCIIWYIGKYKISHKFRNKYSNSESDYLELIHNYLLFLLLFSSLFGVKYIIINIIGTYIITEIIHCLNISNELGIKNKEESHLYDVRKGQLIDFHNILNKKIDDNYAVALNGEWGSGKTLFLKEYMKKYDNENFYIYIKPLITDSIESLIGQISSQLTNILYANGFNLNGKKLIKKYFNEIVKILGEKSKFSFNSIFEFGNYEDTYIDLKNKIQKNIDELKKVTEKKIIFIVDDFDRINEDNQETILDFIKEIVDFNNTITIFAFDYKKINKNDKINHEYLEKFVSEERYLAQISYKEILDYHIKEIFYEINENSIIYDIASEIKEIIYSEYNRFNKVKKEIIEEISFQNKKPEDTTEIDYNKIVTSQNKYWSKLLNKLDNSRRVISFVNNVNNVLKILERKKSYYNINKEVIYKLNLSKLIYIINFIKIFDNDTFIEVIKYGGIEEYIEQLNLHRKRAFKDLFINNTDNKKQMKFYDEESINLEAKKKYINSIVDNTLEVSLYNQESEIIRREKFKIIRDLFIDYNLENSGIDFDSENKKLVEKIDELKSDTNALIFNENSNIDEQMNAYIRAILDSYEDERIKERLEKFTEYCIKLINTRKELVFNSYVMMISNRRHYGINEYIVIFIEAILKYLDNEYEMSKTDKNNILQYIEEALEYIANKYFSIFGFYLEIITNGKLKYTSINEQLYKFTDCNNLLSIINSLLKENCMEIVENYRELYKYFNKKVLEKNNKKINIICIDELNAKFKEFLNQKDKIEELSKLLEPKIKVDYSKIDIKQIKFEEIIDFIQAIKEKITEDKLKQFTKEYWDNFSRSIYYIKEHWNSEMSTIESKNANEIIDTCIFLFNYIKENKIYDDMHIIELSLNMQWLIDNYKQEER